MRFAVDRLDHLVINCRDIDLMASWYQRVLGMEREEFGEGNRTALKFGGQKINLRPHDASPAEWIAARDCRPGTQDLCFVVAVAAEETRRHFTNCGVAVEEGPVPRQGALGAMTSVYTRDPEGNLIEVATYAD